MPTRPPVHASTSCKAANREYDKRRGTTTERGYGWRWQRARKRFLSRPENVLCRMCKAEGRITAANTVDHIIPHKGDQTLMWAETNWQPLCADHHNRDKQRIDKGGAPKPNTGLDGWPQSTP